VADVANSRRAPMGYRFVPDRGLDKEAFPSVMRKIIEAVRDDPYSHPSGGVIGRVGRPNSKSWSMTS